MAEDIRMRLTENATGVSKCYVDAKVSVEAETRETADSVLDGRISGLKSDIEAEVDQRTAADAELEKKANRNATDIQTEHNRAVGMESVLGDAVKTEQRRAEAAEGLIKGLVTQAEEARKSGDDTLATEIATERMERTTDVATLTEAVAGKADASALVTETAERTDADKAAMQAIAGETTRAKAAEKANTDAIASAVTAIGNETDRATEAEGALRSSIVAEVSRAEAAELALGNANAAEVAARIKAIEDESSARIKAIADEATARIEAVKLANEARESGDASLSAKIATNAANIAKNAAEISNITSEKWVANKRLSNALRYRVVSCYTNYNFVYDRSTGIVTHVRNSNNLSTFVTGYGVVMRNETFSFAVRSNDYPDRYAGDFQYLFFDPTANLFETYGTYKGGANSIIMNNNNLAFSGYITLTWNASGTTYPDDRITSICIGNTRIPSEQIVYI